MAKHIHSNTLCVKPGRTVANDASLPRAVNFCDNLLLTAEHTEIIPTSWWSEVRCKWSSTPVLTSSSWHSYQSGWNWCLQQNLVSLMKTTRDVSFLDVSFSSPVNPWQLCAAVVVLVEVASGWEGFPSSPMHVFEARGMGHGGGWRQRCFSCNVRIAAEGNIWWKHSLKVWSPVIFYL